MHGGGIAYCTESKLDGLHPPHPVVYWARLILLLLRFVFVLTILAAVNKSNLGQPFALKASGKGEECKLLPLSQCSPQAAG
jgi:hypothetical protein